MSRRPYVPLLLLSIGACTVQRTAPAPSQSLAMQRQVPAVSELGRHTGGPSAMDDHMAHMNAADLVAPQINAVTTPQDLSLPASANAAAERVKNSPRHAEWVKIPMAGTPDTLMAWVVYPFAKDSRQKAPVVVVVHEIFGLSTWVRGVADQVAADGFIAIAPDFLSRARGGPSSVELSADTARRIIAGVNTTERNQIINAAANYAMMLPSAQQKYAVIGYCWGGQTVFAHAVNGGVKGFSGGVAFYGAPYTKGGTPATATTAAVPASVDTDSLKKISKPVMLLNGSKDARIGALMPALEEAMKGKKYEQKNYEGAVHGFLRAQGDPKATRDEAEEAANIAATKDGWPRTIAFLRKNLK
ncbi:dienelactone hydrolase family protein [Gemmatimonas aurantiaca]|nr:dienelactone hydrolase family protein [Gemmatimonas aurantiaca]